MINATNSPDGECETIEQLDFPCFPTKARAYTPSLRAGAFTMNLQDMHASKLVKIACRICDPQALGHMKDTSRNART